MYGTFVASLVVVAGFFLATMFPLPGNFEAKIVKSGSMEPSIPTGALVLIKPHATYAVGDVITFGEDTTSKVPTTHRIASVSGVGESAVYTTKGDANEEADPEPVGHSGVIGKVLLSVPYAGFVLDFARRPLGFALLIGLPALLIIIDELLTIGSEVRRLRRRRKAPAQRLVPRRMFADIRVVQAERPRTTVFGNAHKATMLALAAFGLAGGLTAGHVGGTVSYFSDIERSLANVLAAGTWDLELPLTQVEESTFAPFMIVGEEASTTDSTPLVVEEPKDSPSEAAPTGLHDDASPAPETPPAQTGEPESAPEVPVEPTEVVEQTPDSTSSPQAEPVEESVEQEEAGESAEPEPVSEPATPEPPATEVVL